MPPAPPSPPESGRRAPIVSWAVGAAGIAAVIVGTFLPWVVSGTVRRNIYTVAGIADRVGLLGPGSGSVVVTVLPLVGPACLLPVVLAAVGFRRTGGIVALLLAAVCGGAAATALGLAAGRAVAGIALATVGPVTVLIGALLLAAGAAGQLRASASPRRDGSARATSGFPGSVTAEVPDAPH